MTISGLELKEIRQEQESLLPQHASIERLTRTADGEGGYTESWQVIGAEVRCRLMPTNYKHGEIEAAERTAENMTYMLTLPYSTDITILDRVQIDGKHYEVLSCNTNNGYRTCTRAMAKARI